MDNFVVSARKYRPSTFKTVVGQDYIVTTLKNAIKNDQIAQAFLFTGPRGVGKTTCARILAKTINCTNISSDFEACNECESCRSFNQSASFNVHELDAASNNSVDDIRTLVDQVRIPPQAGKYKIYIIDEVHMLSAAAFNAFLKTLEEPPAYAKFILATTEKHKIIPTILSRCQVFDFKRIRVEDIATHLAFVAKSEKIDAESQALHVIASKSDGALRDALSIFDQMVSYGSNIITTKNVIENLNILDFEYHFRLIQAALEGDTTSVLLTIEEIYEKGFDGQAVVTGISEHLRSLLVCKDEKTIPLLEVHENQTADYLRQSKACSVVFIIRALEIMNQCDVQYKSAANKRFHIELALLKVAGLSNHLSAEVKPQNQSPVAPDKVKPEQPVAETPKASEYKPYEDKPSAESDKHAQTRTPTIASDSSLDLDHVGVMDMIKNKSAQVSSKSILDKEYSEENVKSAYEKFCKNINDDENRGYESSVLKQAIFEKIEDSRWKLSLASSAEVEAFRSIDIQTFFREELSNRNFSIEFVVKPREDNTSIITKEEKLKNFIHHHPEIQRLMQDLDAVPDI